MILNFGKYRDKTCEEVLRDDPVYVEWILKTNSENPYFLAAQREFRRLRGEEHAKKEAKVRERMPWWIVLELDPNASMDAIKRAYRKQMSLYHPDKVSHLGVELIELAKIKSQEINEANEAALKGKK